MSLIIQIYWYKKQTRRNEIAILMQGLTLPNPHPCSASSLPLPMCHPTIPPPTTSEPHIYPCVSDTMGSAIVRGSRFTLPPSPQSTSHCPFSKVVAQNVKLKTISRTTEWRYRKAGSTGKSRKEYRCGVCRKSTSGK